MKLIEMIKNPFLNGVFLPFKIYCKSHVKIRKGAAIELNGRLYIGNPDKKKPLLSYQPVNLYFGYNSKAKIGASVSIGPGVTIIVKDAAMLEIGEKTYFTSDMHIEVVHSLTIGRECAISWGVTIIDADHHQLVNNKHGSKTEKSETKKVSIGNKVWIGCNVTILKNTTIGNNCVVAANSLVRGTFPENCLIGGNPAKIISEGIHWK
jgi:acetyltransferase-like isoleucine patch superfamily enzyme